MSASPMIKKILAPSDGSEAALRAARYAAEIARCTGAEVTVLNAVEASGVTQFVTAAIPHNVIAGEATRHTATHVIDDAKKPFQEAGIAGIHAKSIEGPAAEVILEEARSGGYDLIAMGSRGIGATLAQRLVLGMGSVAERVLGAAPCPVLIVRE